MKLHLPKMLRTALMATFTAALSLGSATYASTTYSDLTTKDYFVANENVYNTGTGKFYLETQGCALNLTLTLNVNDFASYQSAHDYGNAGFYSPFVTWTYSGGATYGMADVARGYSGVTSAGITGYWKGLPWSVGTNIALDTLKNDYADANGNVILTINNDPSATNKVTVTAVNKSGTTNTLYNSTGLYSVDYTSLKVTAFTVNTNYVKSVTLNTTSTLDSSTFTPPKDYAVPFESERTDGTTVGRILFMGDSITHGVEEMSWRWGLFKTFVDNGIENEIVGPLTGYNNTTLIDSDFNGDQSSSRYGGMVFENVHYAQASGRTNNMITGSASPSALGATSKNYGGVTTAKVGREYDANTYIMMMGTNDILSDGANTQERMAIVTERLLGAGEVQNGAWENADQLAALTGSRDTDPATATYTGKWGTMGRIIDDIKMGEGDTMYVMSIPTWAQGRQDIQVYANYVPDYNANLKLWTEAYSASHTGTVKFVDINRGLVDKTLGGTFLGPNDFFRPGAADSLHPTEQGSLVIAGNLAQGMGLAGRTAGLHRADSQTAGTTWLSGEAEYTINAGQSVNLATNAFNVMGGYTVDFSANFGNGATDGWLDKTNNALSISVGDGSNVGTLKLSEGYISWGDTKLLFCQDNSAQGNDNIRIAYHTGDADHQVGQGYYVWLGDMLIGQALTAGSGTLNGITLSSTGATGTVSGLTYSNTAYAPTTTGITSAENAFYATITKVLESHNNTQTAVGSGITWTGATDKSVAKDAVVKNVSAFTNGKATINVTGTGENFFGATNVTATGNVEARVNNQTASTAFAALGGTLTGDVTMEFSSSSVANGTFDGVTGALIGSYNGASIKGTFAAYIDNTSFAGDIVGGALKGAGSIDGVNLVLNSGAVNGTVYGGSKSNGTVGTGEGNAVSIAVNGGHITGNVNGGGTAGTVKGNAEITINGGIIDGNITGGDIQGQSTVTVVGNKASIGGNITADTVKLKNVEATEYTDAFDKYKGTITATNLVLDNYTAGKVNATLVTDYVTATNGTIATIHGLTLRNCSIDATGATALTLGESIHSGNTISYSGNIRLEDGTSFTIDNPTAVAAGGEGFSDGVYIYKVTDGQTGSLQTADGTALTGTHTATFTGTGDLAGKLFSYESSTGALVAHSNTATYNIVSSTVDYSGISSAAGVTMSGGQLNLDTDLTSGTITATGGTVNIGEGVTLAQSSLSGTTKLAGNGTFDLNSMQVAKPSNIDISDASAWHGTIRVNGSLTTSSGQLEGYLNGLANANSKVELHGVSGHFGGNVNVALVLTGTNEDGTGTALKITNGWSPAERTFTKSIEGKGDIDFAWQGTAGQTTIFTGDISGWTGSFKSTLTATHTNGALALKYTDAATTINSGVLHGRDRDLTITYSNTNAVTVNGTIGKAENGGNITITAEADVTFNNTVGIDRLSASGKTITLGSTGTSHGALTVGGEANIGTLKMAGDGATATFNGTTTLGAIQANGGHGNMVIGGANELAAGSLSVEGANTQLTFEKKITIGNAEGGYANIHYSNTANNGIVVNFNEGLAHTGNGNLGYALLAGNGATVNMGGETDLSSKIIGLAAGATLSLKENASFTVGRIYSSSTQGNNGTLMLGDNAAFTLTGGVSGNNTISALQMADTATVTFNASAKLDNDNQTVGGTVKVNNVTLTLGHENASNTTQTYNRVELNGATLHAATKGDNNVRNFTTLAVGGTSTLTQASWHTLWNIGSLNNLDAQTPGTLTWDSTTNHNKTSIMTLTAAGDFSGKVVVDRHTNNASNGSYQAYLQVNHAQALQNATVELKGRNASNNAALALNTSAVTIAGLEGTVNSIVYAGAANTAPGSTAPTSTGTSTLTINAAADHSFAGTVASGVSLTKEGSGTQTFNGNLNGFNGLVKANGGKLVLNNSAATAEAVAFKGIFINNGTLELSGGKYTVGSTNDDDGLFAETKAVDTGSLVLSNGADLSVDASSKDWRFQVNSGEDAGIYVKGAASSLQASLNDGSSVSFKALDKNSETGAHLIANTGNGQSFKLNASNITVADADYTVNGGTADKTLANKLENTRLTNEGSGKLTVSNSANTLVGVDAQNGAVTLTGAAASAATLTNINAEGGDITLEGLGTAVVANLSDLTIGKDRSVSLYQGTTAEGVEGVITVNGTLSAGENATLNADLVLGTNAKLDFTNEGLNMGSTLTLQSGSTITLGDTIIEYAETMVRFDSITLFTGVDALTIGDKAYNEATTYYAADYFDMSGIAYGDEMTIRYEAGTVSIYMATPEPATATLSLLALAALAARRRRR